MNIFEAAPERGRRAPPGHPRYRLPAEVVERDVANVTAIGVEIRTNTKVEIVDALKQRGLRRCSPCDGHARVDAPRRSRRGARPA